MTNTYAGIDEHDHILIHTSVKLVTSQIYTPIGIINILIHTSVKLVTFHLGRYAGGGHHFNPHEREARDYYATTITTIPEHFNPHEREARDLVLRMHDQSDRHFNPHEREARDAPCVPAPRSSPKF